MEERHSKQQTSVGACLALKKHPLQPKLSHPLVHTLAAISWQQPQGHTSVQTPSQPAPLRGL